MFDFLSGGAVSKTLDIVDQYVEDKDKAAALKAQLYIAELQSKTVPWMDGVHKLGRQMLALSQMAFYGFCLYTDTPITMELVAGVSGVAGLYTVAKGKGRV